MKMHHTVKVQLQGETKFDTFRFHTPEQLRDFIAAFHEEGLGRVVGTNCDHVMVPREALKQCRAIIADNR